jgi:hypothetical protein
MRRVRNRYKGAIVDTNIQDNAQQHAALALEDLAVTEAVVDMGEAKPGQDVELDKEAKAVAWKEIPTAKDMRAYIFAKDDILEEIVEVSEWDVKILVRGMTGKQRSKVMQGALRPDGTPDLERMYPDMCIATCYHPTEKVLLFTPADRDALNAKSGGVLEKLAMTAAKLSGLDVEAAKTISKN